MPHRRVPVDRRTLNRLPTSRHPHGSGFNARPSRDRHSATSAADPRQRTRQGGATPRSGQHTPPPVVGDLKHRRVSRTQRQRLTRCPHPAPRCRGGLWPATHRPHSITQHQARYIRASANSSWCGEIGTTPNLDQRESDTWPRRLAQPVQGAIGGRSKYINPQRFRSVQVGCRCSRRAERWPERSIVRARNGATSRWSPRGSVTVDAVMSQRTVEAGQALPVVATEGSVDAVG